ncbi:thioredoxin-like protein [Zopfochytrium polystomum]|nr:thioredoxin-like protein [Zopfochytrium polystomum]
MDDQALVNFIEFTGATPETAANYLAVSDGNLEQAIALFHESGGIDIGAKEEDVRRQVERTSAPPRPPQYEDDIRQPIAQKHDVLVGGPDDFDYVSYSFPRPSARGPSTRVHRSAFTDPTAGNHSNAMNSGLIFAAGVSSAKADRLAKLFETPRDIMFEGDLDTAREVAIEGGKWLMVTVTDPSEFACECMKRDVWRLPEIKALIKENFIFTFYEESSEDGLRHRTFYPFTEFPYVAIIDPRTGERLKFWNKLLTGAEFQQEVTEFLEMNSLIDSKPAKEKGKSQDVPLVDLTEEEQLEFALAESMGETIAVDDDPEEIQEVNVWETILPLGEPEPTTGDLTRIQFRMPDGTRVVRKFAKSDSVRRLFEFVKSKLPDTKQRFELLNFRDALFEKLNMTLAEANILNSSLSVEIIED